MVDAGGGGGGGVSGEVRQGGIDLLPLYRNARQVLSAPIPPPSHLFFPSLKSVFSLQDLSDLGETTKQSSSVSRLGLSPSPSPRPVFSLIFDFRQTKFIAFLGLAPLQQCLAR